MSVKKVNHGRWLEAQQYECGLHIKQQNKLFLRWAKKLLRLIGNSRGEWNDWNNWWASHFNQYNFLPAEFDNIIELGCGPYTNMRYIIKNRKVKHVICSDPLALIFTKLREGWLQKEYKKGNILLDNHPIESCPFAPNFFDVVVMINVLDHVMDAELCLKNAINITRKGGFFIFGQELTNEEDMKVRQHDPLHPIYLCREDVDPYLTLFNQLLRKDLERHEGTSPQLHYSTLIFAGEKII